MEPLPLDDILVKTYETFDLPVDPFIGDPSLIEASVTAVRRQAGDRGSDSQAIMRPLIALRKKGRLPRPRRAFFGRDPSANGARGESGGFASYHEFSTSKPRLLRAPEKVRKCLGNGPKTRTRREVLSRRAALTA